MNNAQTLTIIHFSNEEESTEDYSNSKRSVYRRRRPRTHGASNGLKLIRSKSVQIVYGRKSKKSDTSGESNGVNSDSIFYRGEVAGRIRKTKLYGKPKSQVRKTSDSEKATWPSSDTVQSSGVIRRRRINKDGIQFKYSNEEYKSTTNSCPSCKEKGFWRLAAKELNSMPLAANSTFTSDDTVKKESVSEKQEPKSFKSRLFDLINRTINGSDRSLISKVTTVSSEATTELPRVSTRSLKLNESDCNKLTTVFLKFCDDHCPSKKDVKSTRSSSQTGSAGEQKKKSWRQIVEELCKSEDTKKPEKSDSSQEKNDKEKLKAPEGRKINKTGKFPCTVAFQSDPTFYNSSSARGRNIFKTNPKDTTSTVSSNLSKAHVEKVDVIDNRKESSLFKPGMYKSFPSEESVQVGSSVESLRTTSKISTYSEASGMHPVKSVRFGYNTLTNTALVKQNLLNQSKYKKCKPRCRIRSSSMLIQNRVHRFGSYGSIEVIKDCKLKERTPSTYSEVNFDYDKESNVMPVDDTEIIVSGDFAGNTVQFSKAVYEAYPCCHGKTALWKPIVNHDNGVLFYTGKPKRKKKSRKYFWRQMEYRRNTESHWYSENRRSSETRWLSESRRNLECRWVSESRRHSEPTSRTQVIIESERSCGDSSPTSRKSLPIRRSKLGDLKRNSSGKETITTTLPIEVTMESPCSSKAVDHDFKECDKELLLMESQAMPAMETLSPYRHSSNETEENIVACSPKPHHRHHHHRRRSDVTIQEPVEEEPAADDAKEIASELILEKGTGSFCCPSGECILKNWFKKMFCNKSAEPTEEPADANVDGKYPIIIVKLGEYPKVAEE